MTRLTRPAAQKLAEFIHLTGRPEWNTPGILHALEQAAPTANAYDIAHALLTIAEDPSVKTPGMLTQPGAHWRRTDGTPVVRRGDHDVPCPEHHLTMPCPACRARDEADALTPEGIAAAKRACLEALAQKPYLPPAARTAQALANQEQDA